MTHWYQKEYPLGMLYQGFSDIDLILKESKFFSGAEWGDDSSHMANVFQRLVMSIVHSTVSQEELTVRSDGFVWTRTGSMRLLCKKIQNGWLFRLIGTDVDVDVARKLGWRTLSDEDPFVLKNCVVLRPSLLAFSGP
ncbi:MAG: hypothetical protein A3J54_00395 [Candidatus Ryanbacteria bacterium RIFCSPHIGHO2_02_FULL_45_13b]|uniref:Uncharacterized protein n=1 Tax=Candidatus Ryanbacteria bacterium RIFCSPHIGHO2_02_FULL_45_13b TaxID=1802117 RepID=A0A1G2G3S0_9BACT|nr:MAG: hypothetical protein A3J54_00395 [Candidatus Ryanbacteria bacterium RIFCSPHIGHO2_02_FULL_45_13b]